MLQQTQVATVLAYFRALPRSAFPTCARWPPPRSTTCSPSGAGSATTAARATCIAAAQVIVAEHGGEFPRSSDALAALPGIGRSTAAAIAAFCFGERVAILDGNVKRVLTRVLAFDGDLAEARRRARAVERGDRAAAGARHRGLHPGPDGPRRDGVPRPRAALPALPGARSAAPRRSRERRNAIRSSRAASRAAGATTPGWGCAGATGSGWCSGRRAASGRACGACRSSTRSRRSRPSTAGWPGRAEALPAFVHVLTHLDWHLQPLRWTLPAATSARSVARLTAPWPDGRWFALEDALALGLPAPLRKRLAAG